MADPPIQRQFIYSSTHWVWLGYVTNGMAAKVMWQRCEEHLYFGLALLLHLGLFCPHVNKPRLISWMVRDHMEQLSKLTTDAWVSSGKTRRAAPLSPAPNYWPTASRIKEMVVLSHYILGWCVITQQKLTDTSRYEVIGPN